MKETYCELSEKKTVKGVDISETRVRYPKAEAVGRSDELFGELCERFAKSVREGAFENDAKRFSEHVEGGGRRSAFPRRSYRLSITVCGESGDNVTVKTEASVTESAGGFAKRLIAYSAEHTVWDRKRGILCDVGALGIKKRDMRAHNGLLVDKNGVFYYDLDEKNASLPKNISETGNIFAFKRAK